MTTEPPAGTRHDVRVLRDVRIPTADPAVTLSADLHLPVGAGPVPALVSVLPYRKDAMAGIGGEQSSRWFAERGYACVLADFRGTGSSDGALRPPFDPGEADDAVAVIEWAAAQPWCDGAVGMWGGSYGAITSMRAATRAPAPLRAILPVMGMIDPERDFVHPDGHRGALASLGIWGADNLALQLLPPLHDHHSAAEWRRWRERVAAEPYLLDMVRHGPGDPVWRDRVIDPEAVAVPALCVGGWRDLFCDGTIRAYERIPATKRLVVGPWMHTTPHESPFAAVDFRGLALRWWDHWLRGQDTGVLDDPPVLLYAQGSEPGWLGFESWPPAKDELRPLAGDGGGYRPDPTTGALSGLWAVPTTGFGLPLDQHDDDVRALPVTGQPHAADVLVVGRPEAVIRLDPADPLPERLVVRLADVDPDGRSTLICAGTAAPSGPEVRVVLWPTAYRVRAGHRLRLVVSDGDFPRLWPAPDPQPFRVVATEVTVPVAPPDLGEAIALPPPPPARPDRAGRGPEPTWQITRDLVHDGIEIVVGADAEAETPGHGHRLVQHQRMRATVRREAPQAARVDADKTVTVHLATGEEVVVTATVRITGAAVWARGEVVVDGAAVFTGTWEA